MALNPPKLRGYELLVYGECVCGWRCALPECGVWPGCPECGSRVFPAQGVDRRPYGLGYVARLMYEQEAAAYLDGMAFPVMNAHRHDAYDKQPERHYPPDAVARWVEARKPVEVAR
jgi:hypothetical protein